MRKLCIVAAACFFANFAYAQGKVSNDSASSEQFNKLFSIVADFAAPVDSLTKPGVGAFSYNIDDAVFIAIVDSNNRRNDKVTIIKNGGTMTIIRKGEVHLERPGKQGVTLTKPDEVASCQSLMTQMLIGQMMGGN